MQSTSTCNENECEILSDTDDSETTAGSDAESLAAVSTNEVDEWDFTFACADAVKRNHEYESAIETIYVHDVDTQSNLNINPDSYSNVNCVVENSTGTNEVKFNDLEIGLTQNDLKYNNPKN